MSIVGSVRLSLQNSELAHAFLIHPRKAPNRHIFNYHKQILLNGSWWFIRPSDKGLSHKLEEAKSVMQMKRIDVSVFKNKFLKSQYWDRCPFYCSIHSLFSTSQKRFSPTLYIDKKS